MHFDQNVPLPVVIVQYPPVIRKQTMRSISAALIPLEPDFDETEKPSMNVWSLKLTVLLPLSNAQSLTLLTALLPTSLLQFDAARNVLQWTAGPVLYNKKATCPLGT